MGYRGVGKDKRLTDDERRLLKRRQAIEPIIGHLNSDHRMDRSHLKAQRAMRSRGVVGGGLQLPLAAADDRPERREPFVVPVVGKRFDGLVCKIDRNLRPQPTAKL